MEILETTQTANQVAQQAFVHWQQEIKQNVYQSDTDFVHSINYYFPEKTSELKTELEKFGALVGDQLETLVSENNLADNLPRLEQYDVVGHRVDKIVYHPSYVQAGDIIYQSRLLGKMKEPGGLLPCLSLLFLSSQTGEAGHNCPIACSAGILRVLQKLTDFPQKAHYIEKLTAPSFQSNFTGAQFLTEIQGGSDVALNAVYALPEKNGVWRIYGEKWFCSNASADLMFVTARYDEALPGTKGLALFLVPARWEHKKNRYQIRRLKNKIGTRTMATGEIDFYGAYAYQVGPVKEGFHLVMDNVLQLSRLFNTFSVLGMGRRAYTIAKAYAKHRVAFSHPIEHYPLVKETLARIKAENTAMLAGAFATARLQDECDKNPNENTKLVLRLLINLQKYLSALWSVEHIHLALGVLAGNGTIETFSALPRLLRDCIVCENWEGTHNVLQAQVLKDMLKYEVDQIFCTYMNEELAKSSLSSQYTHTLSAELEKLKQALLAFRQQDKELQLLQIRLIVDRMTFLYCALVLLNEATHQQKTTGSQSKLDAYHYFYSRHINQTHLSYDKDYLELITRLSE